MIRSSTMHVYFLWISFYLRGNVFRNFYLTYLHFSSVNNLIHSAVKSGCICQIAFQVLQYSMIFLTKRKNKYKMLFHFLNSWYVLIRDFILLSIGHIFRTSLFPILYKFTERFKLHFRDSLKINPSLHTLMRFWCRKIISVISPYSYLIFVSKMNFKLVYLKHL